MKGMCQALVVVHKRRRKCPEHAYTCASQIILLLPERMICVTVQTLVSGSALSEHMEDFYLDTLRALATAEASVAGIAAKVRESMSDHHP